MTKTRIKFIIHFTFDLEQTPFLQVKALFNDEPLSLNLSELSMFIFNNTDELDKDDADFCYSLARLIKKVQIGNQFLLAIPNGSRIALFFKNAQKHKIPLYWNHESKQRPIDFTDTLPYTVNLIQKGPSLICSLENRPLFAYHLQRWLTFEVDNDTYVFANGTVIKNPPESIEFLLDQLFRKEKIVFQGDNLREFLSEVYTPSKGKLHWKIQGNLTSLLPRDIRPIPVLHLNYDNNILMPTLNFKYGNEEIDSTYDKDFIIEKNSKKQIKRQIPIENKIQKQLMDEFTSHDLPFMLQSPGDIATFMADVVSKLESKGWEIQSNVPEFKIIKEPLDISFNIQESSKNWFHYDPNCMVQDQKISLQEMASLIVENQGFIKTKKGFVRLSEKSQDEVLLLAKMGAFKTGKSFSKAEIMPLIASSNTQSTDTDINDLITRVNALGNGNHCPPPASFKGELRQYQQYGVNWMYFLNETGLGGVLADDMGLGKTVQTIAFSQTLPKETPVLIIGPTNVIYNWSEELKKFAPRSKTIIYTGAGRHKNINDILDSDYVISTYGVIKNDLSLLTGVHFEAIILDEAQAIKNPKSQNAQCVKQLNGTFKLALTGTPIENHLQDLWSIFDFAVPKLLGTQKEFDIDIKDGRTELIKTKIKPFVLRREKREVLSSLPEKTEIIVKCPMSDEQNQLYKTVLEAAKRGIRTSTGKVQRLNILTALLKLRQVCLYPGIIEEFENAPIPSGKFEIVKEKISELIDEGHKIVLFSQFTKMLDVIQNWAKSESINLERIDGSVSGKARMDAIQRFQSDSNPGLFIISLKAGGVGINLTSADYVIHFDPWWNPAIESQATDRVHRMGQKNKVIVYKLISEGTIEEKIQELQDEKKQLIGEIIDIDSIENKKIDMDQIKNLLLT